MEVTIRKLKKSLGYILAFYIPILVAAFLYLAYSRSYGRNLLVGAGVVIFGNLAIGIFTQIANYIAEKYSTTDRSRDFVYANFADCFFRSLAGLAEVVFYTIAFTLSLETLVAGYLLLKTVSIWQDKDNYNNKKEGLHTAILRIAVVLSILTALLAASYLKK